MSDGRDSVYQEAFDHGYRDAFNLTFTLGHYKGALCASGEENIPEQVQKISIGNCQTCTNPELIKKNVNDQRTIQVEHNQEFLKVLPEKLGVLERLIEKSRTNTVDFSDKNTRTFPKDYLKAGKSDW